MPTITSFTGEKLLEPAAAAEIKNQTEILLKNKDVAGAFHSAGHLKAELAKLPADKVKPVLDVYRAVTANLKVLALPLLEKEEVKNLLANNLPFVDAAASDVLPASLSAWLSLQPEAEAAKTKEELLAVLSAGNSLSEKIKAVVVSTPTPRSPAATEEMGRDPLDKDMPSTRGPSPSSAPGGLGIGTTMSAPRNDIKKDELFDADEASELANHAAKVNEMGGSPLPTDGAASLADEILKLAGSVQDGENFKRRAQALVVSRLRDVRTTAEIREYLGRPFAVGGLGLAGDALEKALKLIEQEYQKLHASGPGKAIVQEPRPMASPAPEAGLKSPAEESQIVKSQAEGKAALSAVSEAASPAPPASTPRVVRPAQTSAGTDKPRLDDIKRPAADIALPYGGKGQVPAGRLNVGGVNIGTGTVGAPDELKLLTLDDWRSFGGGPAAVNHILEKVNILAKESLSEKMAALAAFRESELFREYVNIGRAALGSGRKLAEVLADAALNSNKMTEDEFFAVAELNGKLR